MKTLFIMLAIFSVASAQTPIGQQLVLEGEPRAFQPGSFSEKDFEITWVGASPIEVKTTIVEGSLQWIRTAEGTALPRARLAFEIKNFEKGLIVSGGVTTFLGPGGNGELTVPFISANLNELHLFRNGRKEKFLFRVRLNSESKEKVFLGASCSRQGVRIVESNLPSNKWVYIACAPVEVYRGGNRSLDIRLNVFWDGADESKKLNGTPIEFNSSSHLIVSANSTTSHLSFQDSDSRFEIETSIPERNHRGRFALGLGPYSNNFQGSKEQFDGVVAMPTLYGSYELGLIPRIVYFGAIAGSPQMFSDYGLYLNIENLRGIDDRLKINLLLGAHGLSYTSSGVYYGRVDFPQGFELIYSDAFKRTYNLTGGAFIYPNISGRSYYNVWIRWGSPSLFYEINYISWSEQAPENILSRSLGFTIGFPLFQF